MTAATCLADVVEAVAAGDRISAAEAALLWRECPDGELRRLATLARDRQHQAGTATYLIMRIVNTTNVCVAQCDFCAFYVLPGKPGGYVHTRDEIYERIDELIALGGELVAFNGGFNPWFGLDDMCSLIVDVRARYGDRIEMYALTVAELLWLARRARVSPGEAAARLRDAGVRWIPGGGAEILTDGFRRRHTKLKYSVAEYLDAQRAIVAAGLHTTATMVIGFDETLEERLEHLRHVRDLQDDLLTEHGRGLFSFLPWTYKPYGTAFAGREIDTREYLRHVALSRIYLDNVHHVRTSVLTVNEGAFEALAYGANDFDLPLEDEVTEKAGARIDRDLERLLAIPRGMGYRVVRRPVTPAAPIA